MYGWRASSAFVQLVVCVAAFTDILLYGIVVPVLPFALSERLGLQGDEVQRWNSILLGIYGVTVTIGSVIVGRLGDISSSRKAPFLVGLIIEAVSTIAFALGRSLPGLLLARIFQGLSSSVCQTIGSALLIDAVGHDKLGQALGWKTLSITVGFAVGPIIGGALYEFAGYFAAFLPALCLLLVEIILRLLIIERRVITERSGNFEEPLLRGENCTPKGYDALQIPHSDIGKDIGHITNPSQDAGEPFPSSDVGNHSKHGSRRRFPLTKLLTSSQLLVAMAGCTILNSYPGAFESVLPLYAHQIFGLNSAQAALVFIPSTMPSLFSPLLGKLVDRLGFKKLSLPAFGIASPTFILMALVVNNTSVDAILLLVMLAIYGTIYTLAVPAMSIEVTRSFKEIEDDNPGIFGPSGPYALAFGLVNSTFSLGAALGTVYGGYLREAFGWSAMCVVMAALSFGMMMLLIQSAGRCRRLKQRTTECVEPSTSVS